MTTIIRNCIVCGGILHEHLSAITLTSPNGLMYRYFCEQPCCQLDPYTRYSVSYLNRNDYTSALVIIDINNIHYGLSFNKEECFTEIGIVKDFLNEENANSLNSHVYSKICKLNYIEPWYDLDSATKVISRVLKIKAFS